MTLLRSSISKCTALNSGGGIYVSKSGNVYLAGASTISNCAAGSVRPPAQILGRAQAGKGGEVERCPTAVQPRGRRHCVCRAL